MDSSYAIRNINSNDFFQLASSRERIKFLLQYAILAPSTHNSQPWLFKVGESSCKIFYDRSKQILAADPIGRDLYVSFGCLLENMRIAAEYFRVFSRIRYLIDTEENLVAEMFFRNLGSLESNEEYRHLIDAIVKRVNARGIFKDGPISQELQKIIANLNDFNGIHPHLVSDRQKILQLAELTAEGLKIAYKSSAFRREMAQWIHHSLSRKKDGIPGYSLRMSLPVSFIFPTLVNFFNIGSQVAKLNYISVSSAPLIGIITTSENNRENWLNVGRIFERITLTLYVAGVKTSIFVASIEIGELYKKVQEIIGTSDIPQLLFCAGYMDFDQKPNLRFSVEEKLIQ